MKNVNCAGAGAFEFCAKQTNYIYYGQILTYWKQTIVYFEHSLSKNAQILLSKSMELFWYFHLHEHQFWRTFLFFSLWFLGALHNRNDINEYVLRSDFQIVIMESWLEMAFAMMKPILLGVAMMEVIVVEPVLTQKIV